jgi:hypothetical protein
MFAQLLAQEETNIGARRGPIGKLVGLSKESGG